MALTTLQAASFQSPDATLGGAAVTSPSVTGHAQTTSFATGEPNVSDDRSCRWFGFPAGPASRLSARLKVTHTSDGFISGGTAGNGFTLAYSLNGGGAWTNIVARANFSGAQGPTVFSLDLSAGQDLTQVQVRDSLATFTNGVGDEAQVVATISGISIEVATVDARPIWMG